MRPKTRDVLRAPRTHVSLKFEIQRQCGAASGRLWADTLCLAALALKVLCAHHVVAGARVCFTNSAMRLRRSALTWLATFSSALRTKSRLISRGISLCVERGVAHADTGSLITRDSRIARPGTGRSSRSDAESDTQCGQDAGHGQRKTAEVHPQQRWNLCR
jgi:hypothetical protein